MTNSPLADQRTSDRYRPDIDGLRAVAVLGVMLYHAGFGLRGGFVGVDVFFVISGYLITHGILHELAVGRFTLQRFWERRLRRILPAALVMMIVVLASGHILLLPEDYAELAQATLAQLGFSGNLFYWLRTGYFAAPAEVKPLMHTWSLAVEEQFYLILPLLLMLSYRCARRWLGLVLALLTISSFIACAYLTPRYPSAAFFLLPTRAWELLIGSLVACVPPPARADNRWSRKLAHALSAVSLTVLLGTLTLFHDRLVFPGMWATLPVLSSAALIHLHRTYDPWPRRLLAHRALVGIGLISYSLYLWHWPLMAFTRYWLAPVQTIVMLLPFALSFPLACVSWKLVEQPVRRQLHWQGGLLYRRVLLAMFVPALAALLIWSGAGWPSRLARQKPLPEMPQRLGDRFGTSQVDFQLSELPRLGRLDAEPSFLVWGDSHAQALAPLIDEVARQSGQAGYLIARGGTPTLLNAWRRDASQVQREEMQRWNQNVLALINSRAWHGVIIVVAWQNYSGDSELVDSELVNNELVNTELVNTELVNSELADSNSQSEPAVEPWLVLERQLSRIAKAIRSDTPVFWIRQPPRQSSDLAAAYRKQALHGWRDSPAGGVTRDEFNAQTSKLAEVFVRLQDEQHSWIDPSDQFFDEQGEARLFNGEEFCYVDDNHVSLSGARLYFGAAIERVFEALR